MQRYDVIVLGGGIAGLGVADSSTRRGFSTVILEAGGVGHATSNNTLRIIHGGFRYLQQLNAARVMRSLHDQSYVARTFPDAVTPLPCLMPLRRFGLKSYLPVSLAAHLYSSIMWLCGSQVKAPSIISSDHLRTLSPLLHTQAPQGALCWYDLLMTEPSLIHSALSAHIRSRGGIIKEQTKVRQVTKTPYGFRVQAENDLELESKVVISTLGPWLGGVPHRPSRRAISPRWCLGFNVVTSHQLHATHALAAQGPDGRLFFCVPRGQHTAIGTWYTPCESPSCDESGLMKPTVPEGELNSFITSFNQAFGPQTLRRQDIVQVDAGILPMRSNGLKGPSLYGAEQLREEKGYCEVMSTKYTTFHSQGEYAVRLISRYL